jgi:hypothetical protein
MYNSHLLDSVVHFWSSAFAGLLVYFLTSIMCSRWYRRVCRSRSTTLPPERVDRSIFLFSLFSGLFASIGVHVYIDFYLGSYEGVFRLLGIH